MHQAAIDFFRLLVQVGAVPGEDFSCDVTRQAYRLNERCYELLKEAYPDIDWQSILAVPTAAEDFSEQIEFLHQQLGCPFIDNLLPRIIARLKTMPDGQAAGYVQILLTGVEQATGIPLYPFLMEALGMAGQVRLEWLLRQEIAAVPSSECLVDLVLAAGGTEADCEVRQGEAWLTEEACQRLFLVWDGEYAVTPGISDLRNG